MNSKFSKLCGSLLFISLVYTGCGGGGGGDSTDQAGDDSSSTRVTGQALRPSNSSASSAPIPFAGGKVTLLDFVEGSPANQTARTQDLGTTDADGNFTVDIANQAVAAIIVTGSTEQGETRISGLVTPNKDSLRKNFNTVTDVACEAGISAINDGTIAPNILSAERIANLESAAEDYLAANPGTNFFNAAEVSLAARGVRQATNIGAKPADAGAFTPETNSSSSSSSSSSAACTIGNFTCEDGTEICKDMVCDRTEDCKDGSDEAGELCSSPEKCCVATSGCSLESSLNCAEGCCCCPLNQICDRDQPENGCVTAPAKTSPSSSDPLSKLFFTGSYY